MKIYFSPFSPYVRKCMVTAHELGVADRIQLLPSNAHPVNRDPNMIAVNPLGKVPTFVCDDGRILYDSRVICEYLDTGFDGKLFPRSGAARWDTLTLHALADGMLDALLLARYEDVARSDALRWDAWRAGQLDKVLTAFADLEAHPEKLANRVDIGTLTLGCAVWYIALRFPEFEWRSRFPKVAAWAEGFGQRESMQAAWALPA